MPKKISAVKVLDRNSSDLDSNVSLEGNFSSKDNVRSESITRPKTLVRPMKVPPSSPEILVSTKHIEDKRKAFESEIQRFVEVSKYFSSPFTKTASYLCENCLVRYPSSFFIEYKRGSVTTFNIKFSNLKLEPVYLKLYKMIPHLDEIKYINMSMSMCKRVPPGLSFNLGFIYDDVNERKPNDVKIIFVASRKSTTPCYQVCEIDLKIQPIKRKLKE